MVSFELLTQIEQGYRKVQSLIEDKDFSKANETFRETKNLEEEITELLEDMLFYDDGADELLTRRIKLHLSNMKFLSGISEDLARKLKQ
ncbi:hypothetical protein UT300012_24300 [Paraclostridium bifermentans]